MSLDPVISSDVNRSGFEFCFHDSEVFFNFPALPINLYDFLEDVYKRQLQYVPPIGDGISNGYDNGEIASIQTGNVESFQSFDEFMEAYRKQMLYNIE